MLRNHLLCNVGAAFLACILCGLHGLVQLQEDPYQLGGDEGHELVKVMLMSDYDARLYKDIWSNQPPLHTQILSWVWRWSDGEVQMARVISLLYAVGLCLGIYYCIRLDCGPLWGTIGMILLALMPQVQLLSISAMLELPAFATALVGCAVVRGALKKESQKTRYAILGVGGMTLAGAIGHKYTAMLVLPAIAVGLFVWQTNLEQNKSLKLTGARALRDCAVVASGMLPVLIWIWWGWDGQSFEQQFAQHFSNATRSELEGKSLDVAQLLQEYGALVWLSIATVSWGIYRRCNVLWVPVTYLMTLGAAHMWNRPYWAFYDLHWEIGFVWCIILACGAACRVGIRQISMRAKGSNWATYGERFVFVLICGVLASATAERLRRYGSEISVVRQGEAPDCLNAVKKSVRNRAAIFVDRPMLAVRSRREVPAQFASIPMKRWINGIDVRDVIAACEAEQVECITVAGRVWEREPLWREYIKNGWQVTGSCEDAPVYSRREK